MADLVVDDGAIFGMCRALSNSALSVVSLIGVPLCDDALVAAAWRRLTLRSGECIAQTAQNLSSLVDSASVAMSAYLATESDLAHSVSPAHNGDHPAHSRPERQ